MVTSDSLNKTLYNAILDGDIISNHSSTVPNVDDILKWNGSEWQNVPFVAPIAGAAISLYPDDSISDLGGIYYNWLTYPSGGTTDTDSIIVNSTTSPVELAHRYITGALDISEIPAGAWEFVAYAFVDSATGVSTFRFTVFKRTSGGVETDLFTVNTPEINNTTVLLNILKSIQPSFSVNPTDRLGIKVFGLTTSVANRTLSFNHNGSDSYSYLITPLGASHNQLSGLNAGDYKHLTASEYTGTGTGVFAKKDSPVFTTLIETPKIKTGSVTYTIPTTDGTNGQVLSTNGSGVTSWTNTGANTSLSNLSSLAINTSLLPATDNSINLGSSTKRFNTTYSGSINLKGAMSGDVYIYARPNGDSAVNFVLPGQNGSSGQVLKTDGSGLTYWDAGGGGSSYSEIAIPSLDIDWSAADTFYKLISTNTTFTFSNLAIGQKTVILKNTGASNIQVTFPSGILSSGSLNVIIQPNKENIYTFIRSNGKTYVVSVTDME